MERELFGAEINKAVTFVNGKKILGQLPAQIREELRMEAKCGSNELEHDLIVESVFNLQQQQGPIDLEVLKQKVGKVIRDARDLARRLASSPSNTNSVIGGAASLTHGKITVECKTNAAEAALRSYKPLEKKNAIIVERLEPNLYLSALADSLKNHFKQNDTPFTWTGERINLFPRIEQEDKFSAFTIDPIGSEFKIFIEVDLRVGSSFKIDANTNLLVEVRSPTTEEVSMPGEPRKLLLFIDYYSPLKGLSVLDHNLIEAAFVDIKKTFKGEDNLKKLKKFFMSLTHPRFIHDIILKKGLLLYGPPGTGKTTLEVEFSKRVGFTLLNTAFTGAEVKGGIVGDTEKRMTAVMERANLVPWLPCCLVIDEIDTIAPNRLGTGSSKADSHQIDALGVLLTVFGGARNIKNLFIFGASNRLSDMDPAFLRRMHGKYFIGLPSPADRRSFFKSGIHVLEESIVTELIKMTTNFSGDALSKVVSGMVEKALELTNNVLKPVFLSLEDCREIVLGICRSEGILLGDTYLPLVLNSDKNLIEVFRSNLLAIDVTKCTGRMLVNLTGKNKQWGFYVERYNVEGNKSINPHDRVTQQYDGSLPFLRFNDAITVLTQLGIDLGLQSCQLITGGTLFRNKAIDDKDAVEFITKMADECQEYSRSMLIFDVDSMVGLEKSETNPDSVGGLRSVSFNLLRPQLWHAILSIARSRAMITRERQFWIVIISAEHYLIKKFKETVGFAQTGGEKRLNEEKTCLRCAQKYTPATNTATSCRWHEEGAKLFDANGKAQDPALLTFAEKRQLVWECCGQSYLTPYSEERCRKFSHY